MPAAAPGPSSTKVLAVGSSPLDPDILARLRECMEFAHRTVTAADPRHPLWDVSLGDVTGHDKLLLEVGLFALICDRGGWCSDEARALACAVRAKSDTGKLAEILRRQPVQLTTLGTILIVLDCFGLTDEAERAALDVALTSPFLEAGERVPFRLLDRRWVLHQAGHGAVVDRPALLTSAACRVMHPIYMSREDAYAITHSVMYATDFGAAPLPAELAALELAQAVDACLAWTLAADDYDLVAELLLTQLLLEGRFSEYGAIAWGECVAQWDALGFLPSPSLSPGAFSALRGDQERAQYAHHHMYHTVLVAGLLCDALLRVGWPAVSNPGPARPAAGAALPPGIGARIQMAADASTRRLASLADVPIEIAGAVATALPPAVDNARFDALSRRWAPHGPSSEVGCAMARDAMLIEAARCYDLGLLTSQLRLAATERPATVTTATAADFLARQVSPNGCLGTPVSPDHLDPHTRVRDAGIASAVAASLGAVLKELARD